MTLSGFKALMQSFTRVLLWERVVTMMCFPAGASVSWNPKAPMPRTPQIVLPNTASAPAYEKGTQVQVMVNHSDQHLKHKRKGVPRHLCISGSIMLILAYTFKQWHLKRTTLEPTVRNWLFPSKAVMSFTLFLSMTLCWCITSCLQWLTNSYFCTSGTICNWKYLGILNILSYVSYKTYRISWWYALHKLKSFFFKFY